MVWIERFKVAFCLFSIFYEINQNRKENGDFCLFALSFKNSVIKTKCKISVFQFSASMIMRCIIQSIIQNTTIAITMTMIIIIVVLIKFQITMITSTILNMRMNSSFSIIILLQFNGDIKNFDNYYSIFNIQRINVKRPSLQAG